MSNGTVYLIGAGPGDPKLITVRGMELLKGCDVVVYDRLAHPDLLKYARSDAEIVYVGKASAHHAMLQDDINALLVDRATRGKSVARLKGGDPFVFGRGGEEAEECRAAGVPFEIVPGITSAIAAPAYAGIPVTHRDLASSFAVITGHERDDGRESASREPGCAEGRRNWRQLAHAADTLLFLMGVEALPEITTRLQENGRRPETPVALIQWGSWTKQRVVTGTLATIAAEVKAAGLTPPAVCVVGDVVSLRAGLSWFDDRKFRPLFGRKILVTRAREQASALSESLRTRGAEPIEFPLVRIGRLEDYSLLDDAISKLDRFKWIVFTSANAASVMVDRLNAAGRDVRAFAQARIAAIGPATAEALLKQAGIRADYIPADAVSEAAIADWPDAEVKGAEVLLVRAEEGRAVIPDGLTAMGANVTIAPAYRTEIDATDAEKLRESLKKGEIDAITFTASSTVRGFSAAIGGEQALAQAARRPKIIAIGPATAATAVDLGLKPDAVAKEHTISGLVAALEELFRENESGGCSSSESI